MLLEIIKQFNWVDVFVLILLCRIIYISVKSGISVEVFKLLGTLLALYLAMHYYTGFSDWVSERIKLDKLPLEFMDFLCFLLLVIAGYLIFMVPRSIFHHFIKMEAVPNLNKWGGLVLGLVRGFFLVSLISYMLVISSIVYLKDSVKKSYSGTQLVMSAIGTYNWIWDSIASKFSPKEQSNKTILEVQEKFQEK